MNNIYLLGSIKIKKTLKIKFFFNLFFKVFFKKHTSENNIKLSNILYLVILLNNATWVYLKIYINQQSVPLFSKFYKYKKYISETYSKSV
uniref:Uncharacterized protein n=1 Tax=Lotharella vacuolata TaxID=74820 RepID=A0A0H5BH02_9EUKA|nr:hypothetical protein [Lotharella vacuolata]